MYYNIFFGADIPRKINSRVFVSGLTECKVCSTWEGSWPHQHYIWHGSKGLQVTTIELLCPGHWQWMKEVKKIYCFITFLFGTDIHWKISCRAFVSVLTECKVFSTWLGIWLHDYYIWQGSKCLQVTNDQAYMPRALVMKEESYKNVLFYNFFLWQ
jgi:hypothetical protein